jgi:hypothetical protein
MTQKSSNALALTLAKLTLLTRLTTAPFGAILLKLKQTIERAK